MRSASVLVAVSAFLASVASAATISAFEPGTLGDDPVSVDVTNASSLVYNADNRNSTGSAAVSRRTDDEWGLWYNRLNLQATWKRWQAGLRLDSALFRPSPTPTGIALDMLRDRRGGSLSGPFTPAEADFFVQKLDAAGAELSNRYIDWVYPAKYWVGYATPEVEATVGDFYAQLGRGLVLSVRKLDELSSDVTVRGGRATGRVAAGDVKLRLTALGGTMNPLRIDETSGRYLATGPEARPGLVGVTEAGMPTPNETPFTPSARSSYAPDRLVGAQIEGGPRLVKVGVQGVLLERDTTLDPDAIRGAHTRTGSLSAAVPDLDGHGDAYVEAAIQSLDHPAAPDTGHAVYGSVTILERPVTVTVEAKHYRRFFPLRANVDLTQAPEFNLAQYSAPPTTEAFWVDTAFEEQNTCVTGGRAKTDVEVGTDEGLFAWVGHYQSWAEVAANLECDGAGLFREHANRTRTWDVATGAELTSQRRKSRATVVVGARFDDSDETVIDGGGDRTTVFYREVYARYDVIRHLGGTWQLQLQGWHRRRRQSLGGPVDPFWQSQHLTGVQWDDLAAAVGVELDTDPGTPDLYFNGQVQYRIDSGSNVGLFVGQRRGGLRCVAGVCRVFPPFEGARVDLTLRF